MYAGSDYADASVQSAIPTRGGSRGQNEGLYGGFRRRKAARLPKGRMLLATLAAISAVIFTVYTCTRLIRRRIPTSSFGRRLAGKGDGNVDDNDPDMCSLSTEEGLVADSPSPVPPFPGLQSGKGLGQKPSTSTSGGAARTAGKSTWSSPKPEPKASTVRLGAKRKAEEAFKNNEEESSGIVRAPRLKEAPLEPAPPLDPAMDSLIDSVLAVGEKLVLASSGQMQTTVAPVGPATYSSPESGSSDEESGLFDKPDFYHVETTPPLDPDVEFLIDSVLAEGETDLLASLDFGAEAAPAPLDPDIDLLIDHLLAKEEESLLSESNTREEKGPLLPLGAGVDTLIDSALGDDSWLLADEEMWEEGSSPGPASSMIPGDPRSNNDDAASVSSAKMSIQAAFASSHLEAGPSLDIAQLSGPEYVSSRGGQGLAADDWLGPAGGEGSAQSVDILSTFIIPPALPTGMEEMGSASQSRFPDSTTDQMGSALPIAGGPQEDSPSMTADVSL